MQIITNNVPRHLIYGYELTDMERAEFDYYSDDDIVNASFVRYKGQLYDVGEFMRWNGVQDSPLAKWDGYMSDSYFSGTLVRFADSSCESVIMARYFS